MNNKKGGFGAKLVLVLILMIASAIGGAYGYRVVDGKLASRDAMKAVENIDVSDYDTAEQTIIQGYIDNAKKDLETAQTRKEVYDIISEFITDVEKVQTKTQKELEQARKEAEEAKQKYEEQYKGNGETGDTTVPDDTGNTGDNETPDDDGSGYKSNDLTPEDDGTEDGNGLIGSLLGGISGKTGN